MIIKKKKSTIMFSTMLFIVAVFSTVYAITKYMFNNETDEEYEMVPVVETTNLIN